MPNKGFKASEETKQRMRESWKKRDPHPYLVGRHGFTEEEVRAQLAAGFRWCGSCKQFLDSNIFGVGKRKTRCLSCQSKWNKSNYQKHRDEKLTKRKAYYRSNLKSEKRKAKDRQFAKYGATRDWYDSKLAEQGGGCAICGATIPDARSKFMFVDHRHECCNPRQACDKCRRGLLCGRCNSSLERIETDPQWGIKALAYLGRYA